MKLLKIPFLFILPYVVPQVRQGSCAVACCLSAAPNKQSEASSDPIPKERNVEKRTVPKLS